MSAFHPLRSLQPNVGFRPIAEIASLAHCRMMPNISERLLDQRLRNRIMEELFALAEWEESLKSVGFTEYFEAFFGFFPYEGEPYPNCAMTEEEGNSVGEVYRLMVEASNATPRMMSEEKFIATGWPRRIEPIAEAALRLMLRRGRFSEEREETEPSSNDGWPWRERFKVG